MKWRLSLLIYITTTCCFLHEFQKESLKWNRLYKLKEYLLKYDKLDRRSFISSLAPYLCMGNFQKALPAFKDTRQEALVMLGRYKQDSSLSQELLTRLKGFHSNKSPPHDDSQSSFKNQGSFHKARSLELHSLLKNHIINLRILQIATSLLQSHLEFLLILQLILLV